MVLLLRYVRIMASRMAGTSPQPATTSEGAGMVWGGEETPWREARAL